MNNLFHAVLNRMMKMRVNPESFLTELEVALFAEKVTQKTADFLSDLVLHVQSSGPNDSVKVTLQTWFIQNDAIREAEWVNNTDPNTQSRRDLIYQYLELTPSDSQIIQEKFPPFYGNPIIAVDHEHWYTEERQQESHYGASLLRYLENRGWTPQNIGLIDQASNDVISNLADPKWTLDPARQNSKFACRGLVVGYVQSGKTTTINLTTAKAIDAGYRLVIILSGTTNLLRNQTQRRVDKEVIGKYFLQKDQDFETPEGYSLAPDWDGFIEHPTPMPGVNVRGIERLTTLKYDFSSAKGATKLSDSWVNSSESSTKIAVIKKYKSRLNNLYRELKLLGETERKTLSVLIIDDESDQASINTKDPEKTKLLPEEKKRTAINREIVQILRLLPNAQYVGVTATPVANCFVDPQDANDMYPRNFILPLARPQGYMGILDFHDLDDDLEPILDENFQFKRRQHIRAITSPRGSDDAELRAALDTWIVAGALKLYRKDQGVDIGRHHTFFYSDSTGVKAHGAAADRIIALWPKLGFTSKSGWDRLEKCYHDELLANSEHQKLSSYFPSSFEGLKLYIQKSIQKIDTTVDGHDVVLVVNSDDFSADIDFDQQDIWKVVVGGHKLSRGYTIEGLTITYFRRKSADQSALMQMGRWFGYRAGYQDLVRLWISRNEPAKPNPIDIYDRYQSVCIDEEKLRRKFKEWYEEPLPDGTKITPLMVRPLIELSDIALLPVAKNKMWNTELTKKGFEDLHSNVYLSKNVSDRKNNESLFKALFSKFSLEKGSYSGEREMFYTVASHEDVSKLICNFSRPNLKDGSDEAYFRKFLISNDCRVNDWLILLPQLLKETEYQKWEPCAGVQTIVVKRRWREEAKGQLITIGDKPPRIAARVVSKTPQDKGVSAEDLGKVSPLIHKLSDAKNRAVLILTPSYPGDPPGDGIPYLGYECFLPPNPLGLAWRTRYEGGLPLIDKN